MLSVILGTVAMLFVAIAVIMRIRLITADKNDFKSRYKFLDLNSTFWALATLTLTIDKLLWLLDKIHVIVK